MCPFSVNGNGAIRRRQQSICHTGEFERTFNLNWKFYIEKVFGTDATTTAAAKRVFNWFLVFCSVSCRSHPLAKTIFAPEVNL